MLPIQPGDVPDTFADIDDLVNDFDYKPSMPVREGVKNFVDWFKEYHKIIYKWQIVNLSVNVQLEH